MSERISGANVRHPAFTAAEWMASPQRNVPQSFLDAMADQTEADAAELQRLKPLAAMAEAIQRVREHPERAKDSELWIDDRGSGCATRDHLTITAPSLTALADKLDAIAAGRVPKPEPEPDIATLYLELLYQVANKIPGETRHETARRIIRQHENRPSGPAQGATGTNAWLHPDSSFTVTPVRGEA